MLRVFLLSFEQIVMIRCFIVGFQTFGEDQGDELALSGIKRSVYSPPGVVLGGFRATSRVSSHSHEDPEDVNLECPFAIDNDESEDYLSRYSLTCDPNVHLLMTVLLTLFSVLISQYRTYPQFCRPISSKSACNHHRMISPAILVLGLELFEVSF